MDCEKETKIIEHPDFNMDDFVRRWRKARLFAIHQAFVSLEIEMPAGEPASELADTEEETRLLRVAPQALRETILKLVFDQSRKFAQSASRYFRITFEIGNFCDILSQSGIPCFRGRWLTHRAAKVLNRNGCASLAKLGNFGCDYWREALDGLVMGAGESERLARHRSLGHGDSECCDVLYTESANQSDFPPGKDAEVNFSERFGAIPRELGETLAPVWKAFEAKGIALSLIGFSEGSLYYRLESKKGVLCGATATFMHEAFRQEVAQLAPEILAKDAAPLAVYGGVK